MGRVVLILVPVLAAVVWIAYRQQKAQVGAVESSKAAAKTMTAPGFKGAVPTGEMEDELAVLTDSSFIGNPDQSIDFNRVQKVY